MPATDEVVTLSPLRCGGCLYDLTGLANGRCPECGREFGDADRAAHARLAWWQAYLPRAERAFALRSAIAVALVAVVVGVADGLWNGLIAVMALAAHVVFTVLVGLACSRAARRWERGAFMAMWLRHLWWVHLPWLCVPLGVVFVAVLGLLIRGVGSDAGLAISLMLLQPWIALVIMSLIGFPGMLGGDTERAGIRRTGLTAAGVLGGLVCVAASACAGLVSGAWLVSKVLLTLE